MLSILVYFVVTLLLFFAFLLLVNSHVKMVAVCEIIKLIESKVVYFGTQFKHVASQPNSC